MVESNQVRSAGRHRDGSADPIVLEGARAWFGVETRGFLRIYDVDGRPLPTYAELAGDRTDLEARMRREAELRVEAERRAREEAAQRPRPRAPARRAGGAAAWPGGARTRSRLSTPRRVAPVNSPAARR